MPPRSGLTGPAESGYHTAAAMPAAVQVVPVPPGADPAAAVAAALPPGPAGFGGTLWLAPTPAHAAAARRRLLGTLTGAARPADPASPAAQAAALEQHMKKLIDAYSLLLTWLMVATVAILVIPVSLQIISRYTQLIPSYIWTEELSRFLFIWMIMLGAMIGIKEGTHFEVDIWPELGRRANAMLRIVSNLFVLIFALVFVYWGIKFAEFGWYQESELAELPMPFIFVGLAARRRELGDLPGRNLLRQYPHRGREGRRGRELWLQTRPYSHRAKHLGRHDHLGLVPPLIQLEKKVRRISARDASVCKIDRGPDVPWDADVSRGLLIGSLSRRKMHRSK